MTHFNTIEKVHRANNLVDGDQFDTVEGNVYLMNLLLQETFVNANEVAFQYNLHLSPLLVLLWEIMGKGKVIWSRKEKINHSLITQ